MNTLTDNGQSKYRKWVEDVYAAVHDRIGPAAGEHQGGGHYENVRFGHGMAYGNAGDEGYIQFLVTLTGKSLWRGAHRETSYRWKEELDVTKVGRELVDLYADLSRYKYARALY
jgi:hypothetical protein